MKNKEFVANLRLLILPSVVATIVAAVWYLVFFERFHYLKEDEGIMTQTGVGSKINFHAIIAAVFLGRICLGYNKTRRSFRTGDEQGFLDCVEDRIPMPVHMLLAVMSVFAQWHCLLLPYAGAYAGIDNNFSMAFILSLYWVVAVKLDDPRETPAFKGKIKPEWLKKCEDL